MLPTGVRLHWREAGLAASSSASPPVIVWIHGGSVEDSSVMVADIEPFFHRVRALFPDTRGHGLSTRFERVEDYTYARKAEDLLLWLDALGVREAVWGGASMGGALSLWIAAHAPERARAVISISGPPFEPSAEDKAWWASQRPLVEAGRFEEYFDANVRLRMGEEALGRLKTRPDRYAELMGTLRRHSAASLLALLDETYSRHDWLDDCRRIRCPVQVIAGSEDSYPTAAMSQRVAEAIPGARLHVVEGGGHFPNRTHRPEVQRIIASFWGQVLNYDIS
ncbi:MAG TPA: alpha/beta hydrolase [Methylomirabilota bacterium]|nr:alpha/beta hydrolase [Methylomirabilota bacterium]